MSFLDSSNSEFLSARITQKGRNSIAKGSFNIEYFQVGDSEFDYTSPFTGFTGQTTHQKVFAPFDKESGVKYPYGLDSSLSTTYGSPIQNSITDTLRNVMGPAGFVSSYHEYDPDACTGTTVECAVTQISLSGLTGTTTVYIPSGSTFQNCEFITVVFDTFIGDPAVITGTSNSLVYRIVNYTSGVTNNTLTLDRPTPNLSGLTGNAQIICNECEQEFPIDPTGTTVCLPTPVDTTGQLNSWTLNNVWDKRIIGADVGGLDEGLTGYTSNRFVSTKELLGYTSTGQTFTDISGTSITYPTSFFNSIGEQILVQPSEQRCVAIIHYSELGDITNDPERFFKYDDYLSYDTGLLPSIVEDELGNPITDTEYFEVYIPFILYHRSTGTTIGAKFLMDTTDYFINSTKNEKHQLMFRYLLDEMGNKVGKVFPKNKTIVFDDQELVAILDYRSNRRYTLGSPKISSIPTDELPQNSILSGSTGQTFWVTYMFSDTAYGTSSTFNALPCNYFNKIQGTITPSHITMKFSGNTFQHMKTSLSGFTDGFVAKHFYALVQDVDTGLLPTSTAWSIIDLTTAAGGNGISYLNPTGLTGVSFVIKYSDYSGATLFDLETHMGNDYLLTTSGTTEPQFGDEQPFPGSIKLLRATDIEQLNFLVNLPSTQFTTTQNPTWSSGKEKYITDIALLNSNKEPLVVAKTAIPVKRVGTQIFSVKLDF